MENPEYQNTSPLSILHFALQHPAPYDWVAWLRPGDAAILLQHLLIAIERDSCSVASLQEMVDGWRQNAHDALLADDYTADVDKYLEVTVDARLFLWRTGQAIHEHHSDRT